MSDEQLATLQLTLERQRDFIRTRNVALAPYEHAFLDEVLRALQKLRSGGYGSSERSGRPIAFECLALVPWARCTAEESSVSVLWARFMLQGGTQHGDRQ